MGRLLPWALLFLLTQDSMTTIWNAMDIRYWKCVLKKATSCPDPDIKFFMYSSSDYPHRKMVDVRNPLSLHSGGWNPGRRSVIIIHGFNETESESPTTFITKAYADRGDYNVFTVDWESLTKFPCYLSALSNTRLVAQCAAMLYSYLTHHGARATKIQCVGHSLGANICGMMSRHPGTSSRWRRRGEHAHSSLSKAIGRNFRSLSPLMLRALGAQLTGRPAVVSSVETPVQWTIQRVHRGLGVPLPAAVLCCSRAQHEARGTMCVASVHLPEGQRRLAAQDDVRRPQSGGARVRVGVPEPLLQDAQDHRHVVLQALDPARPLVRGANKLRDVDANVVQVIHTNAGQFGEAGRLGTVDFCVNGGRVQPTCFNKTNVALCSHVRAVCYMAESVNPATARVAAPCSSRRCLSGSRRPGAYTGMGEPVVMGQHTPDRATGTFCVSNEDEPFCPAAAGAVGDVRCCSHRWI